MSYGIINIQKQMEYLNMKILTQVRGHPNIVVF